MWCRVLNVEHVSMPSRSTYNAHLDAAFSTFVEKISKVIKDESAEFKGFQFLNVIHDIWTTVSGHSCLGATLVYIDKNWVFQYIPVILQINNHGHSATRVATILKETMLKTYKMDTEDSPFKSTARPLKFDCSYARILFRSNISYNFLLTAHIFSHLYLNMKGLKSVLIPSIR